MPRSTSRSNSSPSAADLMLLKVGDLARRTGLTVRTLHHYDEIGLLKPSGRSEAGYRLYSQADVQRLHGIQTMRQMGLALSDIGALLAGDGMAPERIIGQQIRSLDQQIAQATELRGRLTMLRDGLMAGAEPDMGNWLEALALMTTYGKYFSSAELKHIFQNWNLIEADWLIVKELERWGHMFRTEPSTQGRNHAPPGEMIEYIETAIKLRMALLEKYLTRNDLRTLGHVPHTDWAALEQDVQQLLARALPPHHPDAVAAALRWNDLFDTLTRRSPELRQKLLMASANEPLLQAGSPLSAPVRAYLQAALAHAMPAPAAAVVSPHR